MDNVAKIGNLISIIYENLSPIIDSKCILTDLPYHCNVGDNLIWEGERQFLGNLNVKIADETDLHTFTYPKLSSNMIILLHGGGNFGNLYPEHHTFRNNVIERYPDNRIIMFPQSVWYDNEESANKDAEIINRHKNLYLCARDRYSYDFMKKHFPKANILLVPDMAFCIDDKTLEKHRGISSEKTLYFKRLDKELDISSEIGAIDADIHDWFTFEHEPPSMKFLWKLISMSNRLKNIGIPHHFALKSIDAYVSNFILPSLTAQGYALISGYNRIITTRLHAMILSILLYKKVEYIDNTTGKLSAFVDTWLSDLPSVKPFTIHSTQQ